MTDAAKYMIKHCPVRQSKGLQSWGVFEIVDASFSRGISQHDTKEEAEAAMAVLEGSGQ